MEPSSLSERGWTAPAPEPVTGVYDLARLGLTYVDDPAAFGPRLRRLRESAGLSQRQLSFPGCTSAYISRVEAGHRIPSLQIIRELASRLAVDERELALGETPAQARDIAVEVEAALRVDDMDAARLLLEVQEAQHGAPENNLLVLRGLLALRDGDYRQAAADIEAGLGNDIAVASASEVESLGRAYAMLGETEAAAAVFEQRLEAARTAGDVGLGDRVRFSVFLANTLIDSARYAEAGSLLTEAIQAGSQLNDPLARARVYWTQSRLHTMQENFDAARRYAQKVIDIVELTEDHHYLARAHHLLAFVELDRDEPQTALELIDRGLDLLGPSGNDHERAQFALERARALARLGQHEEAAAIAMATIPIFRDTHPLDLGRTFVAVADDFAKLNEVDRAKELYELAVEILEPRPNRYLADAYSGLGHLAEQKGDVREALDAFKLAARARSHANVG